MPVVTERTAISPSPRGLIKTSRPLAGMRIEVSSSAEVAVGTFPQAVVEGGNGSVYVLNSNLVNFAPAGPGSVTVIGPAGQATGTIALTGINPGAGAVIHVDAGTYVMIHNLNLTAANTGLTIQGPIGSNAAILNRNNNAQVVFDFGPGANSINPSVVPNES